MPSGLKARIQSDEGALDALLGTITNVAVPRALNKLRDQANTAYVRAATDLYGVSRASLTDKTSLGYAAPGTPEASINVKGAGFPLILFHAVQGPDGVTVTLKGRATFIKHAFVATMPGGHTGVFMRGRYGGAGDRGASRFAYSHSRLPVNELFTFGPPETLSNSQVSATIDARVAEQAPKVLAQELKFATRSVL